MKDVRREGDRAIRAVWDMTDILLLSVPAPAIEKFAAQLDAENRNQHSKLAARKSRSEKEDTEQTASR